MSGIRHQKAPFSKGVSAKPTGVCFSRGDAEKDQPSPASGREALGKPSPSMGRWMGMGFSGFCDFAQNDTKSYDVEP
jgi:hypothetical protein